jgi:hypothetical protein
MAPSLPSGCFQILNRKNPAKRQDFRLVFASPHSCPVQAPGLNIKVMKGIGTMRRFFIHLDIDGTLQRDEIGLLHEAPEMAYLQACRAIPDLAAAMLRARQDPMRCRFLIENDKGEEMFDVPFSEVIREKAHH